MLLKLKELIFENLIPIKIWLVYSIILTLLPFIYYLLGLSSNLPYSTRTYLFDFWGYFWDGSHYIFISQYGYKFPLQAFFPGYPLLLKFVDIFLPLTFAYRINYLVTLIMFISIYKFMDLLDINPKFKLKSLILLLAYPTSFFFFANYTESLYILLSIWSLIYLKKGNYKNSAIFNFFLGTIKISSIILPTLLTYRYVKNHLKNFKLNNWLYLVLINFISLLGVGGYFLYLQFYQKGYQIYFKAQAEWGRGHFSFFNDYINLQDEFYFERISEILVFIILIFIFIKVYKKMDTEIYVFSLYHFLLPILTGTLLSLNRLSLYCFPVMLYFYSRLAENKFGYYLTLLVFLAWQLAGFYVFINGYFVG